MKRLISVWLLVLLPASPSLAQQSKPPLFDWADAPLVGSLVADEVTSHYAFQRGAREAGVVRHTGLRIGAKVAWFSLIKLYEVKRPQQKKYLRWIKLGFAAFFSGLAIHNSRVNR